MRLYVAASLFTPFERRRNSELAVRLTENGYDVFLPQTIRTREGQRPAAEVIFEKCVLEIDECDAIIGLVDGPDVDSGVSWELGYAYARGKPILTLRTDYRRAEHGPVNIMIQFSAARLVHAPDPTGSESAAATRLLQALGDLGQAARDDLRN